MTDIQKFHENTNKEITGFLNNAVKSPSNDEDEVYEEFEKSMEPVVKVITKARNEAKINYDLVSNIMMLLESTIILNPEISKKRKFFIMKCFRHYNENQLVKIRTKLKNAKKNPLFSDLCPSLEKDVALQMLFNEEYEKSISLERITPGLLELLNTRHNKELVKDFMAHQEYSPKVQDWMNQDSADIAASQYASTLFDDHSNLPPPNSLMNEVDGGRRKLKKKQHHKKSKSRAKSGAKSRAKSGAKTRAKSRAKSRANKK